MKTVDLKSIFVAGVFSLLLSSLPMVSSAAVITDYSVVPAFVQESILPNMLLLIDNSASMYDLAYTDVGNKFASGRKYCASKVTGAATATECTSNSAACSATTEICTEYSRQPIYCSDQTYTSTKTYVGYFTDPVNLSYSYDFATKQFVGDASATFTCSGGDTVKSVTNQVCVIYNSSNVVTTFKASGNYLNWLTASKFDVQKKILTGGKHMGKVCAVDTSVTCDTVADCTSGTCDTLANPYLLAESRGCVGRAFTKKALTADFANYVDPETNNTNTALGITFSVRGPYDSVNPSAPSQGGLTYIDIFKGSMSEAQTIACKTAMNTIVDVTSSNADVKKDVCSCLTGNTLCSGTAGAVTDTKVAFMQSMQACWACQASTTSPTTCAKTDIGNDDMNTAELKCTDIYNAYAVCSNDRSTICTTATPGLSGAAITTTGATAVGSCGTCTYGPSAIVPGNPALFCGNEFMGQYYEYLGSGSANTCSYDGSGCTTSADCLPATFKRCRKSPNAVCTAATESTVCTAPGDACSVNVVNTCSAAARTAGWYNISGPKNYDTAMYQTHRDFCGAFKATPVIDPTDSPSNTSQYDNIPAILGGTAVEANLGEPIISMPVNVRKPAAPTGVVSDFNSQLRIGAMTFNFLGSATEMAAGSLPVSKVCSNNLLKTCTNTIDCVSPGTCGPTTSTTNKDGGSVVHYIGKGKCTNDTSVVCYNDTACSAGGGYCRSDGVGDHTKGLVKAIDAIRATAWTPFAEAYYDAMGYFAQASPGVSRADMRLNSTDFDANRNPSLYRCQDNNILIISDGMATADRHATVDDFAKAYPAAGGATSWSTTAPACPIYAGSVNLDNLAWIARNRNINTLVTSSDSGVVPAEKNQKITTYVVYNGDSNGQPGECDSRTLMSQTATNGGTTLYTAVDPAVLDTELRNAFRDAASGLASGTASSILNNSEGSGSALIQAVFYPKKIFNDNTEVGWIGEMQGLWYFLDPNLKRTSIREDTIVDKTLNLVNDRVVQFYFDPTLKKTLVNRYLDNNGDGAADTPASPVDTVDFENVKSLWKAGRLLWERNLATSPRTIYTSYLSTAGATPKKFSNLLADSFNTATSTELWDFLQVSGSFATATKLIDYVHGFDQTGWRNRKVTITGCGLTDSDACTREWKLGDIITSTPRVVSSVKVNSYDDAAPTGYGDKTYAEFINTSTYKNRGMVLVGANDGMLHAFKLGILKEINALSDRAKIVNPDGTTATTAAGLGQEQWAFIPKQTLPYLRYLADPLFNTNHLYFVDRTPTVADVSNKKPAGCTETDSSDCTKDVTSWRTIMIGGNGIGGATRNVSAVCTNCTKTPIAGIGYSSYFAMDVTDPANPLWLWDFSGDPTSLGELGYSTSGAAIVRISAKLKDSDGNDTVKPDHSKNGKWFAVIASGPSGSVANKKFLGEGGRHLRLFILDLATGTLLRKITMTGTNPEVNDAFAGSLATSVIDSDRSQQNSDGYYSDDALYIPYVKKDTATNTWTKGGVLRLVTKESRNPNDWVVSTVIDDIGPVTAAVTKLQDRTNSKLWLYFGTGRYYYKLDDNTATQHKIYGIKEPCYSTANRTMQTAVAGGTYNDIDPTCTDAISGTLIDQSGGVSTAPSATISGTAPGWSITLDANGSGYMTEREVTDPVASTAGAVFFTTIKPSADVCNFGGNTAVWAVKYDSGAAPPSASMQGQALMQVSTGAFAELSLSDAFNNAGNLREDKRKTTDAITGLSATGSGLLLVTNPKPIKKILHIQER